MKLYQAVARALRAHEVEVVFGLVGDANLYMMDGFRARGGTFAPVANESAALLAAAGYASISGRLGVASVTHGTGLANTVTSLEAVKHRSSVVLIAGDTAADDTDNFQDIDQKALVTSCGALFVPARSPASAVEDLATAIHLAYTHRLPVVFNVPIDFQWHDVPDTAIAVAPLTLGRVAPSLDRVEDAVGVLASARRPLVLAGRGAAHAKDEILAFARVVGAPLATTAQARQLFRDHRLDVGIFGGLSTSTALDVIAAADCIVAFGASLNRWTTDEGALVSGRTIIHVDHEPESLGRHVTPTVPVHGDSALTARAMTELFEAAELPPRSFGNATLAARLEASRDEEAAERVARRARELDREKAGERPGGMLDLNVAMWSVEEAFPARTLVIDAGRFCMTALGIFTVEDPRHYVHTINFGSIGVGLPYAIGAAIGDPSRPTLLLCGDGGFMLGGLTEFNTAVRLGLDLVVVVFNDGSFGAEHVQLTRKGMDPSISLFDWPDLAPVAESLGGWGVTVRSIAELDRALADVIERSGVRLVNVMIDAAEISASP